MKRRNAEQASQQGTVHRVAALYALYLLVFLLSGFSARATPQEDLDATVVLFNETDPTSVTLAGYYAEKRGLAMDHLVGLSCTMNETISRSEYENTIADPLRKAFLAKGWWKTEKGVESGRVCESKIRYVAVIRGIPLKIAPVLTWEGDKPVQPPELNRNEAAVDSELAALGLPRRQISGPMENPCYRNYFRAQEAPPPWMLEVCRLDAPQPATVRKMIDDTLAAERTGLWGFAYVDLRGLSSGPHYEGDVWLRDVVADLSNHGILCIQDDNPALFPEHYPMNRVALYLGWYSEELEGVFKKRGVSFLPGAIAIHIHSLSASSLRTPVRGWCAPLLEMGAAATLGNVYEPYLPFTTHLNVFERTLRGGSTFAEAAYAAQPVLSWMAVFIGDPLYRPFNTEAMAKPPKDAAEYEAYKEGALIWSQKGWASGESALQAKGRGLSSGVIYEGLGLLQAANSDPEAALASWAQARRYYKQDEDCIRCALHSIALLRQMGKTKVALALTRESIKKFTTADATSRLRTIELELIPAPTPAPTPAPANATR